MKNELVKNKKINLTDTQSKYIVENIDKEPIYVNRVIAITPYLGEELQRQENIQFIPEKILIEFILADTEKSLHVYGKLKRNQTESKMYWIPKTQLIDDPYFEKIDVEVDFTKYNNVLAKEGKKLYQHQEEGVKFLLSRNGCILADDMGLGKSIQSIIAALESGATNILVVCPSSAKINWRREINMFSSDTVIIDGKVWNQAKFTIINYDILKNFHTLTDKKKKKEADKIIGKINRQLVNAKFDIAIVDEAHYLKDNKSIRGEIMVEVCVKNKVERVWLLTGTPIANRPMDFFNLLKLINSPLAKNWKFFSERYCDGKQFYRTLKNGEKRKIWLTNGSSNLDELANKVKNNILRRMKSDVLDMPEKVVIPMYHKLSNKAQINYENLWEEYLLKRIEQGKKGTIQKDLVELILLRQFIAMEAISQTIEMVENAIEQGRKVIVFTTFTEELNILANHFKKQCVTHNGPMSNTKKQHSVDEFQNNPNVKVFIGNVISAGVAITLTEATVVIFNSFSWVTGHNEQAEDRAYRIGQKNDVTVYYQLFEETVSIRMWQTLKNKKEVIDQILGVSKTEEELLEMIMDIVINDF